MTTLPLTPLPNTADPNPLVSFQQYQDITGDETSDETDVLDALNDAMIDACNECKRTLPYGQYNEVQRLYKNGMVFPSATPIDPTKTITSGISEKIYDPTTDNSPSSVIQGQGVWVGWFTPLPWMPVFSGVLPPQTQIEYYGGFTQATLPVKLRRAIASMAFYAVHPYALTSVPQGVKSMSVGGVSISGSLSSFLYQDWQIKRVLRRYRHPQAYAWQS